MHKVTAGKQLRGASGSANRAPLVAAVGLVLVWSWLLPPAPALAQPEAETPAEAPVALAADTITAAEIEDRRKQAEAATDLPDEVKKKVVDLYRAAHEQLQQAEQLAAQAAQYKADADDIQARVARLRQQLDALQQGPPQPPAPQPPLSELERQLAAKDLQLKELKALLVKLEGEAVARAGRRKEVRGHLLAAPQRLRELKQQLEAPPPADEPPALSQARRTELLARRQLLQQQLPALHNELAKYDAEEAADLTRLKRDLLAQKIARTQKEFDLLNVAVQRRRDREAKEAVWQAQAEAFHAQPLLKSYAEENQQLAETAQALSEKIGQAEKQLNSARARLEELERQLAQTKKKVENVGLTGAIGLMLRKQRTQLPNVSVRRSNVAQRQQLIDDTQLALFEYDDERSELSTPEPVVREIVNSIETNLAGADREQLEEATREVVQRKREYLDTLIRSCGTYFDTLVELDTTERQLIKLTEEYQNYVDERVLWIRSAKPLHVDFRPDESDRQLLHPAAWREVALGLGRDVIDAPLVYVLAALMLVLGLRGAAWCRRDIAAMSQLARRSSCHEFLPTFRAAFYTMCLALPGPTLLLFLAWRTKQLADANPLAVGIATGLWATALAWLLVSLTRHTCRPRGLAESHFEWPDSSTRRLRSQLRVLHWIGLPVVLVAVTLAAADPEHGQDVAERLGFLLGMAVLAVFALGVLSPRRGIFTEYMAFHPGGWVERLKYVWCWIGVGVPLGLAALSATGFHYTAWHLAYRLFVTGALLLVLVVVRAMLLRLLLVARRRLAIEEARRRRAENSEAAAEGQAMLNPQQLVAAEEQRADFKTQTAQSRRLVAAGMIAATLIGAWCIWSDVIPALGFLDRWPLWTTTVTAYEPAAAGDGETAAAARETVMTVTLADVGLALIIAVVTFVAASNVPGLMEMALLQRLPLDNSVRYAITSLASYAIVMVGVVAGCKIIGLQWSQVQWLATALTFGLAFGLQEMFANFIAGLIILFERPIRVGDIVTVDDTTGVVSRIRIRATTITNWDRKEFIVPNKEFITGKLLNWTLSDQVNRITINVGVAYGSNTKLVHELLLKAAGDHPLILENPPSLATFEGFGDSCLNFCLRTFLPSMENRLPVIHDLHTAIDESFRAAGIEIAFPQRDLHIRSISASLSGLTDAGPKEPAQHQSEAA